MHTKRFLSRSVSSHEASLFTKCVPTRNDSSHEASLLTRCFPKRRCVLTRSVPSHAEFHHSATSPAAHSDELSLQHRRTISYIHNDESFTVLQTDGLLPTNLIDELSRTSSYCATMTSPSLYFKQTDSSPQFSLTSSPFNTGRRAPIAHNDEPISVFQTDGLLPTILIDELSLQHRQTSSYIQNDEPFTVLQTDGLLPTNLIDELSPTSSYCSLRRALHCTSNRRAPPYKSH